jgi:hypothetical protein
MNRQFGVEFVIVHEDKRVRHATRLLIWITAGFALPLQNMLGCSPAALRYTYSNIGRGEP